MTHPIRFARHAPTSLRAAIDAHSMLSHKIGAYNEAAAGQIWAGITGHGPGGVIAEAVSDTEPPEYSALLQLDDVAAAFATSCMIDAMPARGAPTARAARDAAHRGWAAFKELADQGGHIARGAGADASAAWPCLAKVEQIHADPKKMRAIADMAGRMLAALRGAIQRKVPRVPDEITSVERGADLTSLLPEEYAMLGLPVTEAEAFRRLAERQALQYQRAGKERMTKGPLVILIDESASMRAQGDETRNIWAKSAATALTRLAWEGGRPVVWVAYSTATRVRTLMPGDVLSLIEGQSRFLDGGTDIPSAVHAGLRAIDVLADKGFKGADLVLISDGKTESEYRKHLPGAFEAVKQSGARLWSVAIEIEFEQLIIDHSAKYIHLSKDDMKSPAGAAKLAGAAAP